MNEALLIIKREHRNLGALLFCLKALTEALETGNKKPDFRVFHGIIAYIDSFLDRFHHPKEDTYLFPALRRRHPEAEPVLSELEEQHRRGAALLNELRKALSAYEFQGAAAYPAFHTSVLAYTKFEYEHARKEEQEVFPLALEYLQEEDWQMVEKVFAENDDPLFGERPKKEFEKLHQTIVNLTPAPHGVGPAWETSP